MVAATPQGAEHTAFGIGKYGRTVDDASFAGIFDRDLDDVDSEQCRSIVSGRLTDTTFQFLLVAHRRGAGVVDDNLAVVAGSGDNRMCMRAAAGLHRAYLDRPFEIADIKDANPTETLRADVFVYALQPAIEPAARLLDGHDQ